MEFPCYYCRCGRCDACVGGLCIHWPCYADAKNLDPQDYDLD